MQVHGRNVALEQMRFQMMADGVDAVLAAWGRELAENSERLEEQRKKLVAQANDASRAQSAEQAQQAMDAALDARIESFLGSLLSAASDPDSKVAIPDGFRSATGSPHGPSLPDFSALVAEIESADKTDAISADDPIARSQASAAWAIGHGMMPHPGDLSHIMKANNVDPTFAARFDDLAGSLDKIQSKTFVHPQLKVQAGADRLDALKSYVDTLSGYGSARLVKLVSDPGSLLGFVEPAMPSPSATNPKRMPERQFNAMLDNLFKK